jgi:predicted amidohydrolase
MPRKVRIAAIALATVDGMVQENYARAHRLAEIALDAKPDVVLLPEAFAAGYCATDLTPFAEPPAQPYAGRFAELSRRGGCILTVGYIERSGPRVRNAVVVYDRGDVLGVHAKRSLWPDKERPERDEVTLMEPGKAIEVFDSRLGRFAVVICYENMLDDNWREVAPKVDFILSPYNCEGDPSHNNVRGAKLMGKPSAWADRTGTVYRAKGYAPNPGTAGMIEADGSIVAKSPPGVEQIVVGEITVGA